MADDVAAVKQNMNIHTISELRCRHRLPSHGVAGAGDIVDRETGEVTREAKDVLRDWAAQWPDLRPCPSVRWDWRDRKDCERCAEAVEACEA
jgi:hypothetical protein